jgi:hypothetical protein
MIEHQQAGATKLSPCRTCFAHPNIKEEHNQTTIIEKLCNLSNLLHDERVRIRIR